MIRQRTLAETVLLRKSTAGFPGVEPTQLPPLVRMCSKRPNDKGAKISETRKKHRPPRYAVKPLSLISTLLRCTLFLKWTLKFSSVSPGPRL